MSLYVDGCSFVYGEGLPRELSLANLLNATIDKSEKGKSNMAIFEDVYSNITAYDTFVIGFTYSNRYTFYDPRTNTRKHSGPGKYITDVQMNFDSDVDTKYIELMKLFLYFSDIKTLELRSDIYASSIIDLLHKHNKKYFLFGWERRNITNGNIFYPMFSKNFRLPDGHLNEQGMKLLSNMVQQKL
jgi:hypothetical protein